MIVSELKPSLLLKSFGTSIENKSFGCFVSTAKSSLFSSVWTVTFFPEQGRKPEPKPIGAPFIYARNMSSKERALCHGAMISALDCLGDRGVRIFDAVEATYRIALDKGAIEVSPFWENGRLFDSLKQT